MASDALIADDEWSRYRNPHRRGRGDRVGCLLWPGCPRLQGKTTALLAFPSDVRVRGDPSIETTDMTRSPRGDAAGWFGPTFAPLLSGSLPGLAALAALLVLTWTAGIYVLHHAWAERESGVYQMVSDQAREAEERVGQLLNDADQTLLDLRSHRLDGGANWEPERWPATKGTGGFALISPDGSVVAASPHANTSGWPRLMTRLATSADVLAIGEASPGRGGRPSLVPVARRIVHADGSFAGILMHSLDGEALLHVSRSILTLEGCLTLADDDAFVLARRPNQRGTVGMRITNAPQCEDPGEACTGMGQRTFELDGISRISAWRHLNGLPVTVIAGVGYDAAFAGWEVFRNRVIGVATLATALIFLAGMFWRSRRRHNGISAETLTLLLANIDQGVRLEHGDGTLIAANDAGLKLSRRNILDPIRDGQDQSSGATSIAHHELTGHRTLVVGTDLTAQRAAEARIDFLTNHDRLTGLPNRWAATSRIQSAIASRSGSRRMAALVLVDLDGFQDINDTLGHEAGDEVLTEVARRLRGLVANSDVAARLGGDEFLLFLNEPDDATEVMSLARHIPRVVARPIVVRGQEVHLGASMGIALHPRDGADAATLFQHADIALSAAKQAGRGAAQSFAPEMMVSFEEHRMMESDLRRALENGELELRLQPQFSCDTLDVTGFEALARWRHPTRGELSPSTFIPIAERSGLINPLGLWAIEQACKAASAWRTRHRIAVNISPLQLRCETIREDIRGIPRRTQFPAHVLELEVTETVLRDQDQRTLETLHKLRAMDIRVTLDDFGTGYSSLSYLRRFPFDKIKIDKSFIQGQGTDCGTKVILEAMIRMCCDLGFDVVAEGVENEHQLSELRQLGCREIQGFLLGEPLLPEMVDAFVASHGRRPGTARNQATLFTPS